VLACAPDDATGLERLAAELDVPLRGIGRAGGATLFDIEVSHLRDTRESI
jgi:hypothetical protein